MEHWWTHLLSLQVPVVFQRHIVQHKPVLPPLIGRKHYIYSTDTLFYPTTVIDSKKVYMSEECRMHQKMDVFFLCCPRCVRVVKDTPLPFHLSPAWTSTPGRERGPAVMRPGFRTAWTIVASHRQKKSDCWLGAVSMSGVTLHKIQQQL